jgi:hypothetical protein
MSGSDRQTDRQRYRRSISNDGDSNDEAKLRGKMLEALDLQIEAATAMLNSETFIRRAMRWVDDPETGERVRKELPVRFRPWYWKDEQGNFMLDVRYGNKHLEIKPNKSVIEVGEVENLVPTLETLREAVNAGELDKQLATAKIRRKPVKA